MKPPFVVEVPQGSSLVEALRETAGDERGFFHAEGFVEEVEMRVPSQGADRRRSLPGRHALISLSGPDHGPFMVLLSRASENGFELAGGELISARSAVVQALFTPARRAGAQHESETSEVPVVPDREARIAIPRGPAKPIASTWAERAAAAAEERREGDEGDDDEPKRPERGDFVHHFAFGWCLVVQEDGPRLKIRDLQGTGKVREVVIDVLQISRPSEKNGQRAFKLTKKT